MPLPITCPHCGKGFSVAADLRGKKVRCKACQETFVVKASIDEPDEDESPDDIVADRIQTGPRATTKARPVRQVDEDEDRPRRRDKKRPEKQGSSRLLVLLLAGGGAALLVVVVGVVGAIWAFSSRRAGPAPVVLAEGGAPPAPVGPAAKGGPQQPVQHVNPVPPVVNPPPQPPPAKVDEQPAADQPPPGWQQYVHPTRWYAVWLPRNGFKSEESKNVTLKGSIVKFTTVRFETRDKIRLLTLMVALPLKKGEQLERYAVIDAFRDVFLKEVEGTVTSDSEITLGNLDATRINGKEFRIDLKNGEKAILRVVPSGGAAGTIYQTAAIGTQEQVEGETAKIFFRSLKHSGMLRLEGKKKDTPDKK